MDTDNKYGIPFIDVTIKEEDAEAGCLELLKQLRPQWQTSNIKTKVYTAGFMNRLVRCLLETDADEEDVVLVRVFGEGTKLIIDRDVELLSIRILNHQGLAAPIYCRFRGGIAYGYTHGRCPNAEEMMDESIHRLICRELAKFHSIQPNKVLGEMEDCKGAVYDTDPYLFKRTYKFLDIIPDTFKDPEKDARFRKLAGSKENLRREVEEIENALTQLGCKNVLSHNDLLLNNIVLNKDKSKASFIDFEEVYVNFQPFDIAAYVMEYAGIQGGYDLKLIPDSDFLHKWLRMYLEECATLEGRVPADVTERDVEVLYVQVMKFTLTHSIFAGIWCLIQVNFSIKDVDFMSAAEILLSMYYKRKNEMLALKLPD